LIEYDLIFFDGKYFPHHISLFSKKINICTPAKINWMSNFFLVKLPFQATGLQTRPSGDGAARLYQTPHLDFTDAECPHANNALFGKITYKNGEYKSRHT